MRNLPVPSTRVTPSGTETLQPISTMSRSLVTTVMPVGWVPVMMSTIVTFEIAIDASGEADAPRGEDRHSA